MSNRTTGFSLLLAFGIDGAGKEQELSIQTDERPPSLQGPEQFNARKPGIRVPHRPTFR